MKAVLWENQDKETHGLEYFQLVELESGYVLAGDVVMLLEGQPAHIRYQVECDAAWRTQRVTIKQQYAGQTKYLFLKVTAGQVWCNGDVIEPLGDGLYDVDLEITPATNTLPMRRLNLQTGESQATTALWVRFPDLRLERLEQRYTRLDDSHYHYQAPDLDFEAVLTVDEACVMIEYEGLWRRL